AHPRIGESLFVELAAGQAPGRREVDDGRTSRGGDVGFAVRTPVGGGARPFRDEEDRRGEEGGGRPAPGRRAKPGASQGAGPASDHEDRRQEPVAEGAWKRGPE